MTYPTYTPAPPTAAPAGRSMHVYADRLMLTPVPVDYQRPCVLPNIQYLPTELAQAYPYIVAVCIEAIQAKAGANALRIFMYNQMSLNGYNNADFCAFVAGVVQVLDMRMATRVYTEIGSGAVDAATVYAELQLAMNVLMYPELARVMDPNTSKAVSHLIGVFNALSGEVQRYMASRTAPAAQAAQPQWQGQAAPAQPQWQNQPVQPQWQNQPVQPQWQPAAQQPVQWQGQVTQPQPSIPQPAWNAPATPAWNQSPQPAWRSQGPAISPVTGFTGNGAAPLFPSAAPPADVSSSESTSQYSTRFTSPYDQTPLVPKAQPVPSPAQHVHAMRALQEQSMTNSTPAALTLPKNLVKANDPSVRWKPTPTRPVTIAYNPNTSELYYQIEEDGSLTPVIVPLVKDPMDINKHLVVPSYVRTPPIGVDHLDTLKRTFEVAEALNADAQAIKQIAQAATPSIHAQYKDDSFASSLSLQELWFSNDIKLAAMNKKKGKLNLYRSCNVLLDPLVSTKNPKPFVDMLSNASSFAQACAMLRTAQDTLATGTHEHLDSQSLNFINMRLTQRFNDFLKKNLAVENGWIDSFMFDAPGVPDYIERTYSPVMSAALVARQQPMLREALAYCELEFEKEQNAVYLPDVSGEAGEVVRQLNVTYFYTYVTLTSLDLFSTELQMELPKVDVAVGIFQADVPLMRQIAENIFAHEKALDMEFGRHMLQTSDKVMFEFMSSVTHADFYLVIPA